MSIDVTAEVVIHCPNDKVAGFAMDWRNDPTWIGGISEVKMLTEPPFGEGSQIERVAAFLGKRIEYVNEVTNFDPNGLLTMRSVRGPFPMIIDYAFQEVSDGTLARIRVQGDAAGFFKLVGPVLALAVKRSVRKDLHALKRLLESGAAESL